MPSRSLQNLKAWRSAVCVTARSTQVWMDSNRPRSFVFIVYSEDASLPTFLRSNYFVQAFSRVLSAKVADGVRTELAARVRRGK